MFWNSLKKPFFVLAPMADVTDAAFRRLIAKYGKPDVIWTEFVSADGLCRAPEPGLSKLKRDLLFSEAERPIVAQLFTSNPEHMKQAAKLVLDMGFDGIDINMGCPDRSIEKQGAGAAMIKDPARAREIIRAAKEGVQNKIPVSVKTRVGYNKVDLVPWFTELLAEEPAVLTVHARTRKEMSKVPARWEHVREAVELRNKLGSKTLIVGNGDVLNIAHARELADQTGCDGVMLGRAIFGNPWLFSEHVPTSQERVSVLAEHVQLFHDLLGDIKNFAIMKKHFKAYIHGWEGAKELRDKIMAQQGHNEVISVLNSYKY